MTEADWAAMAANIAMALGSIVVSVTGVIAFRVGRNIGRREGSTEVRVQAAGIAGYRKGRAQVPHDTKAFPGNQSTRHREADQQL